VEKVLERFIKKHTKNAALYLQAERRSAEHTLLSPGRAAMFFRDLETAQEFHERYGLKEPMIELSLGAGQPIYGVPLSPALARDIQDVPGVQSCEDRGRHPKKKDEDTPLENPEPRRFTSRDMEELARLALRSWQSVPGLRKEAVPDEPKPERVAVVGGFRRDKLVHFLEQALGYEVRRGRDAENADHHPEDHGFHLPRNGGGHRRG
jgi:hypothetical protein